MEEETTSTDTLSEGTDILDPRCCKNFFAGSCEAGKLCNFKHTFPLREVVCKFLLIYKECSRGSSCPFLHDITEDKLPECRNYMADGDCKNPDCRFKHTAERREQKECIYYKMGFCEHGKFCKFKHVRKDICLQYAETQKCMLGSSCPKEHIDYVDESYLEDAFYKIHPEAESMNYHQAFDLCFRCMKFGHIPAKCSNPIESRLKEIRCFRCSEFGHKSNQCSHQY